MDKLSRFFYLFLTFVCALCMLVLFLVGVSVKNLLLGKSLSPSLQLVKIEWVLVHNKIELKLGVPCE